MDEWVWSNGEMILTGENWNTGRKTLYSVGSRWMNEYGAMVEWYWQGKLKYWERNLSQCHFARHKCYSGRAGIEPGSPRYDADDWPPTPTRGPCEDDSNCTLYIKFQFLPGTEQYATLSRPAGERWVRKYGCLLCESYSKHKWTVWTECRVCEG